MRAFEFQMDETKWNELSISFAFLVMNHWQIKITYVRYAYGISIGQIFFFSLWLNFLIISPTNR